MQRPLICVALGMGMTALSHAEGSAAPTTGSAVDGGLVLKQTMFLTLGAYPRAQPRARLMLASVTAPSADTAPAIAALVQQARYWAAQGRDDMAEETLAKLFRIAPDNLPGLEMLARIQIRQRRTEALTKLLARMRQLKPDAPEIARIEALMRVEGGDRDVLRAIRQMGREGRHDQAVEAMRKLYPNGPPSDDLMLEYWRLVSGTRNGARRARAGLEALVQREPGNARYRLALDEMLTARAPVDRAALARIIALAESPMLGKQARAAWRRALLAMEPSPAGIEMMRTYLQQETNDGAVQARVEELRIALGRQPVPRTAEKSLWPRVATRANVPLPARRESTPPAIHAPVEVALTMPVPMPVDDTAPVPGARQRADALVADGKSDAAIAVLEQAAPLAPDDPWLRFDLARLYQRRNAPGDRQKADAVFGALLARQPVDPSALYAYALLDESRDRTLEALATLERIPVAEREAKFVSLQRRLWMNARLQRTTALTADARPEAARQLLIDTADAIGDDAELAPRMAQALADGDASLGLVDALIGSGQVKEAITHLTQSLATSRSDEGPATRSHIRSLEPLAVPDGDGGMRLSMSTELGGFASSNGRADAAHAASLAGLPAANGSYRKLAELIDARSTWVAGALDLHSRSGSAGKSRFSYTEIPLELRTPWRGASRVFMQAAAVHASAGTLDLAATGEAARFGSVLLCQPLCTVGGVAQTVNGLGLSAGIESAGLRADVGVTPLGFPIRNLVGGILKNGDLGSFSYSVDASRRAVTGSVLSYAGARDPRGGELWGGVLANGVRLGLNRDAGELFGAWSSLGLHRLTGRNVQANNRMQLMGGGYWRLINEDDRLLTVGVNAMLWRFSENAGEYTFGHGGYYSPQRFASVALPVSFGQRTARLSYTVRAAISTSRSSTAGASYFPTRPDLQAQADASAAAGGTDAHYFASTGRGIGRSLAAAFEYQMLPRLFVGGRFEIDRSTDYAPNRLQFYFRYDLDHASARPVAFPPEPLIPASQY